MTETKLTPFNKWDQNQPADIVYYRILQLEIFDSFHSYFYKDFLPLQKFSFWIVLIQKRG